MTISETAATQSIAAAFRVRTEKAAKVKPGGYY